MPSPTTAWLVGREEINAVNNLTMIKEHGIVPNPSLKQSNENVRMSERKGESKRKQKIKKEQLCCIERGNAVIWEIFIVKILNAQIFIYNKRFT